MDPAQQRDDFRKSLKKNEEVHKKIWDRILDKSKSCTPKDLEKGIYGLRILNKVLREAVERGQPHNFEDLFRWKSIIDAIMDRVINSKLIEADSQSGLEAQRQSRIIYDYLWS